MKSQEFEDKATEERGLRLALDGLREAYSDEQASPSTEEKLLAEFRLASQLPRRQPARAWRPWPLAAAAMLLLACGVAVWLIPRSGPRLQHAAKVPASPVRAGSVTAEGPRARGRSDRIVSPKVQVAAASEPRQVKKVRHRVTTRSPRQATVSEKPEQGEFIATMISTPADADYGLQLVRVELPRRTMMSFGLPVDPRQLNRPVKADLIIGPDGLTRAIRFVE